MLPGNYKSALRKVNALHFAQYLQILSVQTLELGGGTLGMSRSNSECSQCCNRSASDRGSYLQLNILHLNPLQKMQFVVV